MDADMDLESVLRASVMETVFEKATNSKNKDTNTKAVNTFAEMVIHDPETITSAVRMISMKIQSSNEWEALQAVYVLEKCLDSNSSGFLAEVGKFRFLNELIKLVSPKYLGNNTPCVVKNKIIDMLKLWSVKYPKESKIREAFDMLKKQGVVAKNKNEYEHLGLLNYPCSTTEDEEKSKMLKSLLNSNKPKDLKAANHLIKTMVKEKEDKEEMRLIANNAKLLSEMLANLTVDSSAQDIDLIKELKEACVRMKPTLSYLITNYSKTTRDSAELLELNDLLDDTIQLYYETMKSTNMIKSNRIQPVTSARMSSSPPTLLDFSSPIDDFTTTALSQSQSTDELTNGGNALSETITSSANTLEEIFNLTLNTPESDTNDTNCNSIVSNPTKLFQDLNALGKSLLEMNTPSTPQSDTLKVSLNDLAGKSINGDDDSMNDDELLCEDDLLISSNEGCDNKTIEVPTPQLAENANVFNQHLIESLQDICVSLVDIRTGVNEKLTLLEDPISINVYIQLTENKPRDDVSVFLVLCNSKRVEPISHFLFQPVVPKDCRLRLQPPSKTELPPYNPHIPVDTIVQVMLIASYKRESIPLKFVVSYNVNGEMMTEMGDLNVLPLTSSTCT